MALRIITLAALCACASAFQATGAQHRHARRARRQL